MTHNNHNEGDAQPAGKVAMPTAHDNQRTSIWTVGTLTYTLGGLVLLFSWLLWGDFALSMRDRSMGPLIEKFLLVNGASNALKQTLIVTLPTAIGLILGPAISYMSDRTRTRRGRRIPFMLIPTPVAGLAMLGIAFSSQIGEWLFHLTGRVAAAGVPVDQAAANYILSVFSVFWMIFSVACIVSGSVFGGLINDVVPRSVLGRFNGLFRAVSLYDGILFNALLFEHAQQHFTLMFALIGILFGGGFALMCLKVKEGEYPPPPVDEECRKAGSVAGLAGVVQRFFGAALGYLRECFTQPYYLLLFAFFTLSILAFRPVNDFTIRYAAQLHMSDGDYGFLVAISYVVSLILAFPLGMLVDRFHPLRMSLLAMFLYCGTALYGALFVHDAATFGIALVAHTVLSGTFFTVSASLGQQLLPRSKFTQYGSAGGIIGGIAAIVYAPLMGAILDATRKTITVDGVAVDLYNYQLTFWGALILSALTIVLMLMVDHKFRAYGGIRGYVAPGDDITTPAPIEPPTNMVPIILFSVTGAALGILAGYVLGFAVQHSAAVKAGVGLASFHTLILVNDGVRNMTTMCIATGVVPFAALGAIAGTRLARRRAA